MTGDAAVVGCPVACTSGTASAAVMHKAKAVREVRNMRLKDQVAIVTGGARNIGREFALGLAKEGASVLVADIRDPESVVAEITEAGGRGAGFVGDLSEEGTVNEMVADAVNTLVAWTCLSTTQRSMVTCKGTVRSRTLM
jgi:short chain dehydrogenase